MKHYWNTVETPLKQLLKYHWNTIETPPKHHWNAILIPLKHHWNTIKYHWKTIELQLKHYFKYHWDTIELYTIETPLKHHFQYRLKYHFSWAKLPTGLLWIIPTHDPLHRGRYFARGGAEDAIETPWAPKAWRKISVEAPVRKQTCWIYHHMLIYYIRLCL